jgi:predicted nucleotidyltransferase
VKEGTASDSTMWARMGPVSARRITIEDVRARRQEILRILAAHGAANPRVFGSVARGTADERSDLLVDLREPKPRGFAYFGLLDGLPVELGQVLGRPVHVTEDPSPEFAARVGRDAVAL